MEKTAKITAGDIAFWILMALIIFVILWKLVGSPTDTAALISVALFIIVDNSVGYIPAFQNYPDREFLRKCRTNKRILYSSELLLWRAFFGMEKRTAISFVKMKSELNNNYRDVGEIKTDIKEIKNIMRKK